MKIVLAVLLAWSILGCASAPTEPDVDQPVAPLEAAPEPSLGKLVVTGSSLNVRSGPDTDRENVAKLRRGTYVDLIGENGKWKNVRLADGTEGWVHGRYVRTVEKCQPDRDAEILDMPPPHFSAEGGGRIVVEVLVETDGSVGRATLVSNTTGDEGLAIYYVDSLEKSTFSPAVRDCRRRRALLRLSFDD